MPKNTQGFSLILLILLVSIILVGAGIGYVSFLRPKATQPQEEVQIPDAIKEQTKSWKDYKLKYGQIALKYPPNLLVKHIPSNYYASQYVDFFYVNDDSTLGERVITLEVGFPQDNEYQQAGAYGTNLFDKPNFIIPSLGSEPKAFYSQQNNMTEISFTKDGVRYRLTVDLYQVNSQKLDPVVINNLLDTMAKTITFTNEQGSCEEPVLKPLSDFPNYFVLSNRHKSDNKDPFKGYGTNPNGRLYENDKINNHGMRTFLVSYEKDGASFSSTQEFQKTIVPISGYKGYSYDNKDKTGLLYVNCPNDFTDNEEQIYRVGEDSSDPFAVNIYGLSSNPTKLWGQEKWNTDLLKQTRNTVYIKMGDKWQKYKASDYIVTMSYPEYKDQSLPSGLAPPPPPSTPSSYIGQ